MRRTQLYLDDDLWSALHTRARKEGTTISNLVRAAARRQYLGKLEERQQAMQAFIGIRRNQHDSLDSADYVRGIRRGKRIERLRKK